MFLLHYDFSQMQPFESKLLGLCISWRDHLYCIWKPLKNYLCHIFPFLGSSPFDDNNLWYQYIWEFLSLFLCPTLKPPLPLLRPQPSFFEALTIHSDTHYSFWGSHHPFWVPPNSPRSICTPSESITTLSNCSIIWRPQHPLLAPWQSGTLVLIILEIILSKGLRKVCSGPQRLWE